MKKTLIAIAAVALASTALAAPKADGKIDAKEYDNSFKGKNVPVTVNYTIDGDTIYFGLECETTGWCGIGWNPTGSKKSGADMIMAFIDKGKVQFADLLQGRATGAPDLDTDEGGKDNILTKAAAQNGKTLVVEFSRKLDTGDKKTDVVIKKGENVFLLAIGDKPDFGDRHSRSQREEIKVTLK